MNDGGHVFSVDLLERNGAKGHGLITCMAAGNDVILIGTTKGWLIRHDFGVGDSYDVDLSGGRGGEQPVHRVFVDPGGSHCIANVLHSGGAETYYTHAKWARPRVLSRLKGLVVNAVAWNRQQITESSTREVILGTENGQMYEISVDEVDKKEKYIKFLFELTELPEAIMGLQMETASVGNAMRYYVMAVTPTRLYSFTGIGALDTVFASYSDRAVHFMELPGEIPNSELHFFIMQRRAKHFAWLSGAGIYHGELNFGAQHSSSGGDENFVENKGLLNYEKLGEAMKPRSLAVSEYHFLLLIGEKVKVVNRISQKIVEELKFDHAPDSVSKGIIGLCSDATAGLFYAYDDSSLFQVSTLDEGRDMWKVYLDTKEYAASLASCRSPLQRDQVYLMQADDAFSSKDYLRTASFFAKVACDEFERNAEAIRRHEEGFTDTDREIDVLTARIESNLEEIAQLTSRRSALLEAHNHRESLYQHELRRHELLQQDVQEAEAALIRATEDLQTAQAEYPIYTAAVSQLRALQAQLR